VLVAVKESGEGYVWEGINELTDECLDVIKQSVFVLQSRNA